MVSVETLLTFIVYLVFLMIIGAYFFRRTGDIEGYLLGGRGLGSWVTALSAQASDMSGWLLMGLPGAIYVGGLMQSWIAIGLAIGTFFNWYLVSARLRVYTHNTRALTLSTFFEERFKDPTGLLRVISAAITIFFFTIYSSSGLVASGKLFESMFQVDYHVAVLIGGTVIVGYTFLGGFLAVCWTDFVQGSLMFFAILVVPVLAYTHIGSDPAVVTRAMAANEIAGGLLPAVFDLTAVLGIVSAAAWGLGYFGQPHILARFMGIRSIRALPRAMTIAMIWVVLSLGGAVAVGLLAVPMYPGLAWGNNEKVFIYMIQDLFNPWLGGILLAAILSAIMSTIDSQLLVSSSTLTEDFYKRVLRRQPGDRELMWMGRVCVLVIAVVALALAMDPENTVLGLVAYAWGGFGAAFGPLVLAALYSRRTTWQAALAGMLAGTAVLIAWKLLGWDTFLYEIVPGFIANLLTILGMNCLIRPQDDAIGQEFTAVVAEVRAR
ncbi:MAG: sodium/proline symporter PutP [Acidobacteria bacterium]|nr:sodium/proline symporter PutP [Acidobacteriota bacterium]